MGLRCAVILALVTGCFQPDLGETPFRCGEGDRCPPGYACDPHGMVCTRGAFADVDAGDPDAEADAADSAPDADLPDADPVDAAPPVLIVPANLTMAGCASEADEDLVVAGAQDVDTGGAICDLVQAQGGGLPALCILLVKRFEVPAGATLTASGGRALVVLATDEAVIAGTIDVGGQGGAAGPGGTSSAASGDPGDAATVRNAGGGGGHQSFGGTATGGGPGGMAGDEDLSPLVPAGRGGNGAGGAPGGGNGGLLQIVGCQRLVLGATAIVDASGAGGGGGAGTTLLNLPSGGGGGGGAGGGILLEGARIEITAGATLVAGGGGGGEGGVSQTLGSAVNGEPGSRGQRTTERADGGDSAGAAAGDGGRGGAVLAVEGGFGGSGNSGHGGGGGAPGRIRLNALEAPATAGAVISPGFTAGVTPQRL